MSRGWTQVTMATPEIWLVIPSANPLSLTMINCLPTDGTLVWTNGLSSIFEYAMFCLCRLLSEVQILFEDLQVRVWELYICGTSCLWWVGQSIKPFFSNTEMCVSVMSVNEKFMLFWHSCVFAGTFLHESVPQLGQPGQKNLDTPLGVSIIQSNQKTAHTVYCVICMSNTTLYWCRSRKISRAIWWLEVKLWGQKNESFGALIFHNISHNFLFKFYNFRLKWDYEMWLLLLTLLKLNILYMHKSVSYVKLTYGRLWLAEQILSRYILASVSAGNQQTFTKSRPATCCMCFYIVHFCL